jgi:hypothetical protein
VGRADDLRAQLAVAELEEALVAAKDADADDLGEVKADLRYARWVARGGPAVEQERLAAHERAVAERDRLVADNPALAGLLPALPAPHTNRAAAGLFARWLDTQEG